MLRGDKFVGQGTILSMKKYGMNTYAFFDQK